MLGHYPLASAALMQGWRWRIGLGQPVADRATATGASAVLASATGTVAALTATAVGAADAQLVAAGVPIAATATAAGNGILIPAASGAVQAVRAVSAGTAHFEEQTAIGAVAAELARGDGQALTIQRATGSSKAALALAAGRAAALSVAAGNAIADSVTATGTAQPLSNAVGLAIALDVVSVGSAITGQAVATGVAVAVRVRVQGYAPRAPKDTLLAVHQALYDKLQADLLLLGLPVYDRAPDNAAFPYVLMGRVASSDDSTLAEVGDEHLTFLSCWSEVRGNAEVLLMLEAIHKSLHNFELVLGDGHAINCRVTQRRTDPDADGHTFTGSATVRVLTNH